MNRLASCSIALTMIVALSAAFLQPGLPSNSGEAPSTTERAGVQAGHRTTCFTATTDVHAGSGATLGTSARVTGLSIAALVHSSTTTDGLPHLLTPADAGIQLGCEASSRRPIPSTDVVAAT